MHEPPRTRRYTKEDQGVLRVPSSPWWFMHWTQFLCSKNSNFVRLTPVIGQGYPLPQWQLLALRGEHPRLVPPPDMRTVFTCPGRSVPASPAEGKIGLRAQATQHPMRRRKRQIPNEEKH